MQWLFEEWSAQAKEHPGTFGCRSRCCAKRGLRGGLGGTAEGGHERRVGGLQSLRPRNRLLAWRVDLRRLWFHLWVAGRNTGLRDSRSLVQVPAVRRTPQALRQKARQQGRRRLGRRRHSGFHGDWGRGYPWRLCVRASDLRLLSLRAMCQCQVITREKKRKNYWQGCVQEF